MADTPLSYSAPVAGQAFPATRLRRTRQYGWLRRLVAETVLTPSDLIWPLFVHGREESEPVAAMPGVDRLAVEGAVLAATQAVEMGIPAVALFPVVDAAHKSDDAREAFNPESLVCRAVRAIRREVGDSLGIICDVALDPYTPHGHDGLVQAGRVLNDETVEVLCRQALVLAAAGCHVVAPSDMMDGRVGAIRKALDAAGYTDTAVMAYSAKYNSAYYGPFREAVGSAQAAGTKLLNKATYQMNPANRREAVEEMLLDVAEGADVVMVKPAGAYLDIIREVRNATLRPVAAYQVSGEYAQIHAAARMGWLDLPRTRHESLLAIKRAGADMILTYFAQAMAKALQ